MGDGRETTSRDPRFRGGHLTRERNRGHPNNRNSHCHESAQLRKSTKEKTRGNAVRVKERHRGKGGGVETLVGHKRKSVRKVKGGGLKKSKEGRRTNDRGQGSGSRCSKEGFMRREGR